MQYKLFTEVTQKLSSKNFHYDKKRSIFLIIIFMPLDIVGRSISNVKYSESATGA